MIRRFLEELKRSFKSDFSTAFRELVASSVFRGKNGKHLPLARNSTSLKNVEFSLTTLRRRRLYNPIFFSPSSFDEKNSLHLAPQAIFRFSIIVIGGKSDQF